MKIIQQWSAFRTAERQWDDVHEGQLVEVHFTEGPVVIGVRENKSYFLGNICDSCIFFVAHTRQCRHGYVGRFCRRTVSAEDVL